MRRTVARAVLSVAACIVMMRVAATAHPMGPNSHNQYSAITARADQLDVFYIADIAEFPTYRIIRTEISTSRAKTWTDAELAAYRKRICPEIAARLKLTVDGRRLGMQERRCRVEVRASKFAPPAPGRTRDLRVLERRKIPWYTLWIEMELTAPFRVARGRAHRTLYEDGNFADMPAGWKEIELLDSGTARITEGRDSLSRFHSGRLEVERLNVLMMEMDMSQVPGDTSVIFTYEAGGGGQTRAKGATRVKNPLVNRAAAAMPDLPRLLNSDYFPPVALVLAFILGCLHALSPGHGKTMVAAYLIGTRGSVTDALLLGMIVTVSHVFSVVVLGVIIMTVAAGVNSQRVDVFLQMGSGMMITAMGIWMIRRNAAAGHGGHEGHCRDHGHPRHGHGPERKEPAPDGTRLWDLLALGVTGGIVPCPTALIVLFSAVALNKTAFGLSLIAVFSFGLAAVLIAIGVLMVKAKGFMDRRLKETGAIRALPYLSAAIIVAIGAAFIIRAADAAGWL